MEKTVTALEIQKNNPNRVNVYLDDEFAFGVSRIVGAWLQVGNKLDSESISDLTWKDAREKAFQKALSYINYQPRSEFEVREKLSELGFNEAIIDDVLAECLRKVYINDLQFAKNWVESRSRSKPRSRKMLSFELRKKHISEETIHAALTTAPEDEELAEQLAQKYVRRFAHLDQDDFKKKMTGVLARRAFSFSVINSVINNLLLKRNVMKK